MGDGSRILLNKIYDERQQENYHADFRDNVMEQLPTSSAPSGIEDDSGFTDEASEIHRGGLIEDLLGPRFKQRNRDAGIHIHIGAVHYHGEPHPQGLYNDPSRYGYTQQPPQPCHPLRKNQYASSTVPYSDHHSSAGHIRVQRRHSNVFENFTLQRPDTDTKVDEDELGQAKLDSESASTSEKYVPLSACVSPSDTAFEDNVSRLRITQSEQVINGVPSHLDISVEMEGDKSVMWTGKLQCAPSAPDLRPPSAALHRPKSVIYINSAHIGKGKTVIDGAEEVDYVNYNQPFTKAQAYRIASAGAPSSPDSPRRVSTHYIRNKQTPVEHKLPAASSCLGRKTWKSTTNLTENTSFNESNKKSGTKCSTFYCVPEGFHPDIEDDNEKAHIKECLYIKGKSGNWVILPLQSHPLNRFCLEVKSQDEVLSFPVMLTHKKKYKIDPSRKGFKCICKLVEFYKKNKLPSCNMNLGIPFPKSLIPPTEAEADCSDEVKRQYAGIRL